MTPPLAFHREATVIVAASSQRVFAFLDDHQRLSAHMQKPSLMMAGATMKTETDSQRGQAVGSRIRMFGRMLGIPLSVDETVIEYEPPFHKSWQTCGEPRLWVIGQYRMGFELSASGRRTRLRVWIEYDHPPGLAGRWLGKILGTVYANWCVTRMAKDAASAFH